MTEHVFSSNNTCMNAKLTASNDYAASVSAFVYMRMAPGSFPAGFM